MNQRFQLQAHEVGREKLVREQFYEQSGDFGDVLPKGVWNDSQFVWSRYNPRHSEGHLFGHLLFRPEQGSGDENFFVGSEARLSGGVPSSRPGEFFFGEEGTESHEMESALTINNWGRVFYLNGQGLRREEDELPCDWALFLSASGLGLWKWTMRDGVTWGEASANGLFCWHENPSEAARFLARTPSLEVWAQLQQQLKNPDSEMAFARRWLQLEDEEDRLDALTVWTRGSRAQCEWVLRALALSDQELQGASEATISWSMRGEEDSIWLHDEDDFGFSSRLQNAFALLREYFGVRPKTAQLPLCAQTSLIDWQVLADIENPTAHERLEAQLQLQAWAKERGLSFG